MSIKELVDNPSFFPVNKLETKDQNKMISSGSALSVKEPIAISPKDKNDGQTTDRKDITTDKHESDSDNGILSSVGAPEQANTPAAAAREETDEPKEDKSSGEENKENLKGDSKKGANVDESNGAISKKEQMYRENALKLFKEEFVTIEPEEYTRFLAADDDESLQTRKIYMDLFEWDASLLVSTRMLCSKLYLKGESQEIDRILSAFTQSYINQHQRNIFCTKNFEKIYIILYSLILLNTSLHNGELNKRSKISQAEYIRNTFSTFVNQNGKKPKTLSVKERLDIERELSNYYDDLAKNELYLKQAGKSLEKGDLASNGQSGSNFKLEDKGSPILSRQVSASSIWSSDTNSNRRSSLFIQHVPTGGSGISQLTSRTLSTQGHRVGLARALASDQNKSFSSNNSFVSVNSTNTMRRPSLDPLAYDERGLLKKSSRASIISKDTIISAIPDDTISISSFASEIKHFNIDYESPDLQYLENFDVEYYQDDYDLTLELQGSPYLKEGILKLKILNDDLDNSQDQDPKINTESRFRSFFKSSTYSKSSISNYSSTTTFAENFVVVSKGELCLYSFDPKVVKKHQQKMKKSGISEDDSNNGTELGDGNWLKNAAKIGTYNLCSTYSQLEKNSKGITLSNSPKNSILWSLSFPKVSSKPAKKFMFEAGTKEIALEFVNTCNFWASKITAIPTTEESVSSIEYGWNNLDKLISKKDEFKKMKNIQRWESLPKGVYLSSYVEANELDEEARHLAMIKQFVKTVNYYNNLRKVHQEFKQLKLKFISNFKSKALTSTSNYNKIMTNYERKSNDYLLELRKYKTYLIILGFGLQLRFDLQDDESGVLREEFSNGETEKELIEIDEDDVLKKAVKIEIYKLFASLDQINSLIPNYDASKTISHIVESKRAGVSPTQQFPLVKSPKTFTLSNYNNHENPIAQLLASPNQVNSGLEIPYSHSTRTIKEEEELDA